MKIDTSEWSEFRVTELFDVVKGKRLTKADMKPGDIRFIGSSAFNNGITAMIGNTEHVHPANSITVTYNGSIGEVFYQEEPFWASDDVNVLYPKFNLNRNIALFIMATIRGLRFKYDYIYKWMKEYLEQEVIKLPVTSIGTPDWGYMDNYMDNVVKQTELILDNLKPVINK